MICGPNKEPNAPSCIFDETTQSRHEMKIVSPMLCFQPLKQSIARVQVLHGHKLPILVCSHLHCVRSHDDGPRKCPEVFSRTRVSATPCATPMPPTRLLAPRLAPP